jgi:hypothetical protein
MTRRKKLSKEKVTSLHFDCTTGTVGYRRETTCNDDVGKKIRVKAISVFPQKYFLKCLFYYYYLCIVYITSGARQHGKNLVEFYCVSQGSCCLRDTESRIIFFLNEREGNLLPPPRLWDRDFFFFTPHYINSVRQAETRSFIAHHLTGCCYLGYFIQFCYSRPAHQIL